MHENWSYSDNSLLGLALSRNFRVNIKLLEHHRSHTDIISFSNKHFYDGNLRITTCYDDLTLVSHDKLGVRWKDVKGSVARPKQGGALSIKQKYARLLKLWMSLYYKIIIKEV